MKKKKKKKKNNLMSDLTCLLFIQCVRQRFRDFVVVRHLRQSLNFCFGSSDAIFSANAPPAESSI